MGQNVRTIQYMSYQGFIYTCYLEIPGHIYWLGVEQATNNYLYQCWSTLLKQICVTRPRWVNSEWHLDVCVYLWYHRCSRTTPAPPHLLTLSHYCVQCQSTYNAGWLWFAVLELNNIYYAFDGLSTLCSSKRQLYFVNPGTYGVVAMPFARFIPFFRALHNTNH